MQLQRWRRLPVRWIEDRGLRGLVWAAGKGADNVAALMLLIVVANHTDDAGMARLTYNQLCQATGMSRAKVSAGLSRLYELGLVEKDAEHQSLYKLVNPDAEGRWGKLPGRGFYRDGRFMFFHDLKLRSRTELDALKLFLLFISRRDRAKNLAFLNYEQITYYTGVDGNFIRSALSLLCTHGMVVVEFLESNKTTGMMSHAYRVPHVASYLHMGTIGRDGDGKIQPEALRRELA